MVAVSKIDPSPHNTRVFQDDDPHNREFVESVRQRRPGTALGPPSRAPSAESDARPSAESHWEPEPEERWRTLGKLLEARLEPERGGSRDLERSGPEDARRQAEEAWSRLAPYSAGQRRALVSEPRQFRGLALCERLCKESLETAEGGTEAAIELADLALLVVRLDPGSESWRAENALRGVRDRFVRLGEGFGAALVTVGLAELYARDGRTVEVKNLAGESASIVAAKGVNRETQRALERFREAAEAEQLTAELARRLGSDLWRARHNPDASLVGSAPGERAAVGKPGGGRPEPGSKSRR